MARLRTRKHKVVLNRSVGGDAGITFLLVLLGAFMFLPMLYVIMQSLKPLDELWMFPPRFYVVNPTFRNFKDLFVLMNTSWVPFSRYIFNTVFITVLGTVGNLFFGSLAAYAFSKVMFPGRKWMFKVVRSSLMFHKTVTAVTNFIIMSALHMVDTYWALIIPAWGHTLGLYLMKQFMESNVTDAVLESARLDGASEFKTFWADGEARLADAHHLLLPGSLERRILDLHPFRAAQVLQLRHRTDHCRRHQACGGFGRFAGHYDGGAHTGIRHNPVKHHRDDGIVGNERLRGQQSEV